MLSLENRERAVAAAGAGLKIGAITTAKGGDTPLKKKSWKSHKVGEGEG